MLGFAFARRSLTTYTTGSFYLLTKRKKSMMGLRILAGEVFSVEKSLKT
jgi:hypothetical protein